MHQHEHRPQELTHVCTAALLGTAQSRKYAEDIAFSIPKVVGNVPLAALRWWDLQSSYHEQVCWCGKRQEQLGIVSYTQMLKFKAKISMQLKRPKFCF